MSGPPDSTIPSTRSSSAGIAGPGIGGTAIASAPAPPTASRYVMPSAISRRGGSACGVATSNGLRRISDVVTAISGMEAARRPLRTEMLTPQRIGSGARRHDRHLSKDRGGDPDGAYRRRAYSPSRRTRSAGRQAAAGVGELASARPCGAALAVEPESNGGCGSYSIRSWIACATSSPAMRAASVSAMSMPDDTPADVTTLPCSTTRWDRWGDFVAGVGGGGGERLVDARRPAGRRPHLSLLDDAFGRRLGAVAGEGVEVGPVRRRAQAVEHARRAEQQRAGADRRRPG